MGLLGKKFHRVKPQGHFFRKNDKTDNFRWCYVLINQLKTEKVETRYVNNSYISLDNIENLIFWKFFDKFLLRQHFFSIFKAK